MSVWVVAVAVVVVVLVLGRASQEVSCFFCVEVGDFGMGEIGSGIRIILSSLSMFL